MKTKLPQYSAKTMSSSLWTTEANGYLTFCVSVAFLYSVIFCFFNCDFREKQIQWWCPLKRFVIFPNEIHISHSMRTFMNKEQYGVSFNQAFHEVIQTCGNLRMEETGAWLGKDIMKAYIRLHEQGFATSVEVWEESCLVGGLYGVTLGKCFFGESMFSLVPNASKLALIYLAQTFQELGGTLIDCQFETPHLKSMGGRYIDYEEYMRYVQEPLESL
ncbi:leucyl/phenylalanyl-tRNA--protein transferase [Phocaeicola vulgatus]|nr:leucyl/phenylalanyl-tRNA--protein transferase [Phocaeicola vulgatus]